MVSFQWFQRFTLEDFRSNGKGILQMLTLLSISLRYRFHCLLGQKDGEGIVPLRSLPLGNDFIFPLGSMGQGIGEDRFDMFNIDFRIFEEPRQGLSVLLDGDRE